MQQKISNILISRTDSIGDVILTMPLAAKLKEISPGIKIGFLGKKYTAPVISACEFVDVFIDLEDFLQNNPSICGEQVQCILHVFPEKKIAARAKQLHIPMRVGTRNRLYHWFTCNSLFSLSRKKSFKHEALLNLEFLKVFDVIPPTSISQLYNYFGLTKVAQLKPEFSGLLSKSKFNIIIHPKSQGSAREWPLRYFSQLIGLLDKDQFKIFISGTANEATFLKSFLEAHKNDVTDITGKMDLTQFISFIHQCDGLVANSTGPLHLAAVLGKLAFGIYPPIWPMNPVRWAPVGPRARAFVMDKSCDDCRSHPADCHCILELTPQMIANAISEAAKISKK
ncbi:MAG: glycosyltransferase family 9 protein [Ginsengibacter sp.]